MITMRNGFMKTASKPFSPAKLVVIQNPAQIQNQKTIRLKASPNRIITSPTRYDPKKNIYKTYKALKIDVVNPGNLSPQKRIITKKFIVKNVNQPSNYSVRLIQPNSNRLKNVNANFIQQQNNLNNINVSMQKNQLNKANINVYPNQNNFNNNNYSQQQNNFNNNVQQQNNFNNNYSVQQNNFNNNYGQQQNNFNNNYSMQQNNFNNNYGQQQNNFNNNYSMQQNNFNNFNNYNQQAMNSNNMNNNINNNSCYPNQNNYNNFNNVNNNFSTVRNPTNINPNFSQSEQEMTLSIHSPPKENNYRLIKRGQEIGDLEYSSIVAAAKQALNCRDDPLSNGVTRRIKSLIGGEWFVYVCMEGLKGYDFNLSVMQGNEYVSFILGDFHFQVCKLHN